MFCHFEEYELGIYPMQEGDLIESRFAVERRNRTIYKRMREYEAQGQEKSEEK